MTASDVGRALNGLASGRVRRLEGVSFPQLTRFNARTVRNAELVNVDLTAARLTGPMWSFMGRMRFEGCRFESVNLDGLRALKVDFSDCLFQDVQFGHGLVGQVRECLFHRCRFEACQLSAVSFEFSSLVECQLEGISGRGTSFDRCMLRDVTLGGELEQATFKACSFQRVDFAAARLADVRFEATAGPGPDGLATA